MYLSNNIVTAYQWKQNFVKIQPISSANHQKKIEKVLFWKNNLDNFPKTVKNRKIDDLLD